MSAVMALDTVTIEGMTTKKRSLSKVFILFQCVI